MAATGQRSNNLLDYPKSATARLACRHLAFSGVRGEHQSM
jgi:hypothetical protein